MWAGDEPLPLKFSGFIFKVPPHNETAKKGPGSIYKFESARDSKDRLQPGTAWVTDGMANTDSGGRRRIFNVDDMCVYLQEEKPHLFEQGFAIVSDLNDVAPAMPELRNMFLKSQDRKAQGILNSELERQKKWTESGRPVPEPENPDRVAWAMKHLASRRQAMGPTHEAADITAVLEGKFQGEVAEMPNTAPLAAVATPNGKELFVECNDWGVRLSKREIEALLTGEEDQIAYIVEKLNTKKQEAGAAAETG